MMYCIKITVDNKFYISKIEYDDIFKNKELYSPIYKKFKNLTMSVNLIKDSENIFINAIASRLLNSGVIYGDIILLLDNRENNLGAYIELLTEIIKDEALSNSQIETYKKYGGLFDDDATTSETDEEEEKETEKERNERLKKIKFVQDYKKSRSLTSETDNDEEEYFKPDEEDPEPNDEIKFIYRQPEETEETEDDLRKLLKAM